LEILNGCQLIADHGVTIDVGTVSLIGNPTQDPVFPQTAEIIGKFKMTDGLIGFSGTPTQVGQDLVWGTFHVQGDVVWSGGVFNPGVDCRAGGSTLRNQWVISGTLTIPQGSTAMITPVPQLVPQGQGTPQRIWEVIVATGGVTGDPGIPQGWNLLPVINAGGVKTGFRVEFVGP
jgi:hypothetical protein